MGTLEIEVYSDKNIAQREIVSSLLVDFARHHAKTQDSSGAVGASPIATNWSLNAFEQPDHFILLSKIDGMVMGCVGLRPYENTIYENTCEMVFLFVKPAFRGFGFGHQLLESFLHLAREKNYSHVLFDPIQSHEAIRQLYLGFGFEEIPPIGHSQTEAKTWLLHTL